MLDNYVLTSPDFDERPTSSGLFVCSIGEIEFFICELGPFDFRGGVSEEDAVKLNEAGWILRICEEFGPCAIDTIEDFVKLDTEWATEFERNWASEMNQSTRVLYELFANRKAAATKAILEIISPLPILPPPILEPINDYLH